MDDLDAAGSASSEIIANNAIEVVTDSKVSIATANLSTTIADLVDQDVLPTSENLEVEAVRQACLRSLNPVGEIIEIAQRLSLRPPDFVFEDEQGPPHNRHFTCSVKFESFDETGYGRAKKSAKRQAAIKLLYKLKTSESFVKQLEAHHHKNGDAKRAGGGGGGAVPAGVGVLNHQTISRKGTNHSLPNIYAQLRASQKDVVKRLLAYDVEKGDTTEMSKELLDQLTREENFDYKIYQKAVRGLYLLFIIQMLKTLFCDLICKVNFNFKCR